MSAVLLPLGFFAAAVCIVLVGFGRAASARFAAALVAFELLLAGLTYNPFVKPELVAPKFEFLKAIPRDGQPERVLGVDTPGAGDLVASKGDFLVPNTATLYGLEDVRGDESLRAARYLAYVRRIVPRGTSLLASVHIPVFDSPLLDALNTRFVMSAVPLDGAHLQEIFGDRRAWVYRNSRAVPRAHLVGRWWSARSLTSALNLMSSRADFIPRRVAVVEAEADSLPEESGELPSARATVLTYGPSRVVIETESDRKALLVLADTFYPGWKARVDDQAARILIANGTLRGIFLEAGTHRVVFSYRPATFTAGAAVSLASVACCLLLLLTGLFRRSRRGQPTDSL
jgi:hypothetical protein